MANLTSYTAVRSNMLVRLNVAEYRTTSSGSYSANVLRFTDSPDTETYNSEDYIPLGKLLNISENNNEIRPTANGITISISGIPSNSVAEIIHSKIKGAPIAIYRRYKTIAGIHIDTQSYFTGTVDNWSIQEELQIDELKGTSIILLECTNRSTFLERQISGRKTNPQSQQRFYASDTSMDRVPTLKGTKFNFGAP